VLCATASSPRPRSWRRSTMRRGYYQLVEPIVNRPNGQPRALSARREPSSAWQVPPRRLRPPGPERSARPAPPAPLVITATETFPRSTAPDEIRRRRAPRKTLRPTANSYGPDEIRAGGFPEESKNQLGWHKWQSPAARRMPSAAICPGPCAFERRWSASPRPPSGPPNRRLHGPPAVLTPTGGSGAPASLTGRPRRSRRASLRLMALLAASVRATRGSSCRLDGPEGQHSNRTAERVRAILVPGAATIRDCFSSPSSRGWPRLPSTPSIATRCYRGFASKFASCLPLTRAYGLFSFPHGRRSPGNCLRESRV